MANPEAAKAVVRSRPVERRNLPFVRGFYGLTESPFDLTPNPRFVFHSARHREVLSNLQYTLTTSRGFTLVLGEAGTGKTTLVRTALSTLPISTSRYVVISNPTLSRVEFYEYLAREFELSKAAYGSKTQFLAELQDSVEVRYSAGGLTGLIVDRGPEPATRASRRDPTAREHRNADGQAAEHRAVWTAGAR